MYFWTMKVLSLVSPSLPAFSTSDETSCLISESVEETLIPFPRFVFSPGFTIHTFLGTL
jgi:hypothetical protein